MSDAVYQKEADQSRYAWVRSCIQRDIRSGKYPVGSLLPPEHQLAADYGVSRHTIRQATGKLADSGQISRHPGIGTIVCAPAQDRPYVAALGSASDLFAYTSATRLEVLASRRVVADARLVALLGCEEASHWLEMDAFRHAIDQTEPISFTRVYLRPEFAEIEKRLRGNHPSIYSMLEQQHAQVIHGVRQGIGAALMPATPARLLGVPARSAALHLLRAYLGADGRVLAVSSNLYVAERFKLETSWTQPQQARAAAPRRPRAARKAPPSTGSRHR